VPLRPSRLPDSGSIFTFSNGVRMEKLSRFVLQGKQGKFYADCTCSYRTRGKSIHADVAGYDSHMAANVVDVYWLIVGRMWY